MSFESTNEGAAASVYLALYAFFTFAAVTVVFHKGIKSRFTILLLFGIIRVGAQLCGVVFATLGFGHWQWLVAYLVLGAEGYFTLILGTFYALGHAYADTFGQNRFGEPLLKNSDGSPFKLGFLTISWKSIFHYYLIGANAMVISGGTMLSSLDINQYATHKSKVNTSKGLRGAGQAMFLILTITVSSLTVYARFADNIHHVTINLIFALSPFLLVRGIYGLLSCFVSRMNYFQLSNYTADGLSNYFVATEYCLATTMEFITACILISAYFFNRHTQNHSLIEKDTIVEERKTKSECSSNV